MKKLLITSLVSFCLFGGVANAENSRFPSIQGTNLNGKKYNIPEDMKAKYNLFLIAFKRNQQKSIDTWTPFANELSKKYKNFKFYEIPVLSSGIKWLSSFIDGGMRSGIPDKNIREHTITAYISKDDFLKNLSITNENDIHVYLLDEKGVIVWKSEGNFNDKNKEELEKLIN